MYVHTYLLYIETCVYIQTYTDVFPFAQVHACIYLCTYILTSLLILTMAEYVYTYMCTEIHR